LRRDLALPRYRVILHSNPTLDLMFVVRSVMELTRFPRAEATHKMWEAHHRGRSILLTTWLERAELYVEQFAGKGLATSIEPAGSAAAVGPICNRPHGRTNPSHHPRGRHSGCSGGGFSRHPSPIFTNDTVSSSCRP